MTFEKFDCRTDTESLCGKTLFVIERIRHILNRKMVEVVKQTLVTKTNC